MRKTIFLTLAFVCVFMLFGCVFGTSNGGDLRDVDGKEYIVLEATDSYLIVADIAEDGSAVESMKYSVSNMFYPNTKIEKGYVITIKHSDEILESYPMQFGKVYYMEYFDAKADKTIRVKAD